MKSYQATVTHPKCEVCGYTLRQSMISTGGGLLPECDIEGLCATFPSSAPFCSSGDESIRTSQSELSIASSAISTHSGHSHHLSGSSTSTPGKVRSGGGKKAIGEKEKKFICSYPGCSRAFSRNFNLSTHYNTHLGVKPFACSHCPKSFSRRHDCARHVAAVHAAELKKACSCNCTCPEHDRSSASPAKVSPSLEDTLATAAATADPTYNVSMEDVFASTSALVKREEE